MKIMANNKQLNVFWGATAVLFSTVYGAQKKVYETEYEKKKLVMKFKSKLSLEISQVYNHIVYLQNQEKLYFYLDSLSKFFKSKQQTF
jgi:cobalt-zinc-cadmium resistance protein CzcA